MFENKVQEALFQIEGPDEDGCVWACSTKGRDVWCAHLGPRDKVAEVLSQWLGSIDYCEKPDRYERANPGYLRRDRGGRNPHL